MAGLEDTLKAVTSDVQLLQTHSRALEAAIGSSKAEVRCSLQFQSSPQAERSALSNLAAMLSPDPAHS
ncbi:MAG: hypothetical protein SGPRY_013675 [Prymnesium sp.]